MDRCFRLALTGTPGVGKTTISSLLADVGYQVETVQDIAERFGCIDDVDSEDGARPIDIDDLNTRFILNGKIIRLNQSLLTVISLTYYRLTALLFFDAVHLFSGKD